MSEAEISNPSRLATHPLVSVLVLAYNHEAFLAQCLESIVCQETPFDFEVVLSEDCSVDQTLAVALDFQKRHPLVVRVLHDESNLGMMGNLRRGIEACHGRYTAFCEGDDFWTDPGKLARQVAALEQLPKAGMAFSRGDFLHTDGRREPGWDYGKSERVISLRNMLDRGGSIAPSASLVFRTKILKQLPDWFYEAPVADIFMIIACSHAGGALYQPENTCCYRTFAEGSWTSEIRRDWDARKIDHAQALEETITAMQARYAIPSATFRRYMSDFRLIGLRDSAKKGRYFEAFRTAFILDPAFLLRKLIRGVLGT